MTQAMITAARLIAHKSINGKYQSLMQMDQMDNLGQYVLRLFFSNLIELMRLTKPNDPLHRLIHHRLCQLCDCSVHWKEVDSQRFGRLRR